MDFDFSTILYIIGAILYFVFTANKKGKSKQRPKHSDLPDREGDTLGPPPMRQPTFEELLEEFTGKRKQVEERTPIPEPIPEPVSIRERKPLASKERKPLFVREKAKSSDLPKVEYSRFDEFETEEEDAFDDYRDSLRDLNGAKRAFVLGEIFNKKY